MVTLMGVKRPGKAPGGFVAAGGGCPNVSRRVYPDGTDVVAAGSLEAACGRGGVVVGSGGGLTQSKRLSGDAERRKPRLNEFKPGLEGALGLFADSIPPSSWELGEYEVGMTADSSSLAADVGWSKCWGRGLADAVDNSPDSWGGGVDPWEAVGVGDLLQSNMCGILASV